jgi:hypothetical protein
MIKCKLILKKVSSARLQISHLEISVELEGVNLTNMLLLL